MRTTLKKYGQEVLKIAERLHPHYPPARVHDLRTAVKKLRALLRWQDLDKKICRKHVREIYHGAGDIRNIQVLLKYMRTKKITHKKFTGWLKSRLEKSKKNWHTIYRAKIIHRMEEKLQNIKVTGHDAWFSSKIKELQLIFKNPTDNSLHEARKIYKDFQYVCEWSQKNNMSLQRTLPGELVKSGKMLGQYHDRCVAIEYLEDYLVQEKNSYDKTAATHLEKKWVRQKSNEKKSLLQFFSTLI